MKERLIEELYRQENTHWWHIGKRLIALSLLERALDPKSCRRLLEIGPGPGRLLEELSARVACVEGVDRSEIAVGICRERGLRVTHGDIASYTPAGTYDAVVCLDVLEHCNDDTAVVKKISDLLADGGVVLISVPAYQWLWSFWDEVLEHRRRYTRRSLSFLTGAANLTVERMTYSSCLVFPAIAAFRLARRIFPSPRREGYTEFFGIPPALNALLVMTYYAEKAIMRLVNLPFGSTLFCVARRRTPEGAAG